jgi:phospho-N-acetylmuramoyl-pentapeptide-transferase
MDVMYIEAGLTLLAVFLLTVVLARIIIPILKSHKAGVRILEIGPRWHKSKEGTPIMGGICFILAILIAVTVLIVAAALRGEVLGLLPMALTLVLAVGNGLIGFVDDFCKLVKKQNEGLRPWQKLVLQLLIAVLYLVAMVRFGGLRTALYLPYFGIELELGIFYYALAIVIILGFVNSVNLTDGVDGLASSVTLAVGLFFAVAAILAADRGLLLISACIASGTLGFLMYNFHPARVFMGDTGSLFLGGIVVGAAFQLNNPLILLVVGFIYLCEAASVILQVGYFRLTHGKRLFKMAPIHHHFEKCGWGEIQIVFVFTGITLLFAALALCGI